MCHQKQSVNQQHVSENYNTRVKFLVVHYTVGDWQSSLDVLTKSYGQVSAHYLIPQEFDGSYKEKELEVYQLVDENLRAWHAGPSQWENKQGINDQSIGIELVNSSTCIYQWQNSTLDHRNDYLCNYHDFSPKQIELLIELSKGILARHPEITPTRVLGHSDIQVDLKSDPGPRFPWHTLYKHGIGAWYDDNTVEKYWRLFTTSQMPSIAEAQCALQTYGYGIKVTTEHDEQSFDHFRAFQLHFRPWLVNGEVDVKTMARLWALLEKYFPESLGVDGELLSECELISPTPEIQEVQQQQG